MSLWRKEDPVIQDGVVVAGGMFEHQRTWWDLPNFVRLLVTGFGGGKTQILCKRAIALALHNAPAPSAIVSPSYSFARDTTVRTTEELLYGKSSLIQGFSYSYTKSEHTFYISYGHLRARVIVYSGEDPDRLRGFNLGAVCIDEPFIQEEAVLKAMVARIRHPAARRRELNCNGTPESLNWGYELAHGKLNKVYDVGMVQADTGANRALGTEYRENLVGQFAAKERDAYVHGKFVNLATGLVYYAFLPERNVRDLPMPTTGTFRLGAGMDFGSARKYASMASVVFWHDEHRIHVFDEHEQANSDTPYMCGTLRDLYVDPRLDAPPGEPGRLIDIYPDASGNNRQSSSGATDFDAIHEAGFDVNARSKNPERRDRYNRMNLLLEQGRLTFSPACETLVRYLGSYNHDEMHKQKQMSHLLDAIGYAVYYLFPPEGSGITVAEVM